MKVIIMGCGRVGAQMAIMLDQEGPPLREPDGSWNLLWPCLWCGRNSLLIVDDGTAFVCR